MPVNNNDIRIQKSLIREKSKTFRLDLSQEDKYRLDRKIGNRLLNLWHFREAELVLIYVSNAIEIDTKFIIEQSLKQGKQIAVPRCVEGTRDLEFYLIKAFDELEKGSFGIFEPIKNACEKLENYSNALCVVPALAFDEKGYRLGFGKGYYDRFLSGAKLKTVGVCYDGCIFETLPNGKYDRKVDMIVTESRIMDFETANY